MAISKKDSSYIEARLKLRRLIQRRERLLTIVGLPASGKTAYLYALFPNINDDSRRFKRWRIDSVRGELSMLVSQFEDQAGIGTWERTHPARDTYSAVDLFGARRMGVSFNVGAADGSGEVWRVMTGAQADLAAEVADREHVLEAIEARVEVLKSEVLPYSPGILLIVDSQSKSISQDAVIFHRIFGMIHGTGTALESGPDAPGGESLELPAADLPEQDLAEVARNQKRFRRRRPFPLALALSKADMMVGKELSVPAEFSRYAAYRRARGDSDVPTTGTYTYQIRKDELLNEAADPLLGQAIAWDWLCSRLTPLASWLLKEHQLGNYDVTVYPVSAWGKSLPRNADNKEIIPHYKDISPYRLLDPVVWVLDRLYKRQGAAIRTRLARGVMLAVLLLILAFPGAFTLTHSLARSAFRDGRYQRAYLLACATRLNPYSELLRWLAPRSLSEHVRFWDELAMKLLSQDRPPYPVATECDGYAMWASGRPSQIALMLVRRFEEIPPREHAKRLSAGMDFVESDFARTAPELLPRVLVPLIEEVVLPRSGSGSPEAGMVAETIKPEARKAAQTIAARLETLKASGVNLPKPCAMILTELRVHQRLESDEAFAQPERAMDDLRELCKLYDQYDDWLNQAAGSGRCGCDAELGSRARRKAVEDRLAACILAKHDDLRARAKPLLAIGDYADLNDLREEWDKELGCLVGRGRNAQAVVETLADITAGGDWEVDKTICRLEQAARTPSGVEFDKTVGEALAWWTGQGAEAIRPADRSRTEARLAGPIEPLLGELLDRDISNVFTRQAAKLQSLRRAVRRAALVRLSECLRANHPDRLDAELSRFKLVADESAQAACTAVEAWRKTLAEMTFVPGSADIPGFYMAPTEATIAEYREFLQTLKQDEQQKRWPEYPFLGNVARLPGAVAETASANDQENAYRSAYSKRGSFEKCPVNGVSEQDAAAYCRWRSALAGGTVRLPTPQEWDHAAGKGKYPWGDQDPTHFRETQDFGLILPGRSCVADKQPELELYDLGLNVQEWTSDPAKKLADLRSASMSTWHPGEDVTKLRTDHPGESVSRLEKRQNVGFRVVCEPLPGALKDLLRAEGIVAASRPSGPQEQP